MDIKILNLDEINFISNATKKLINRFKPEQDELLKENLKSLRFEHCSDTEPKAIQNLSYKYRDIFYCEGIPRGFTNEIIQKINLPNNSPTFTTFTKSYRFPEIYKNEFHSQITKMLEQRIIQPSTSVWSKPTCILPKKLDYSGKQKWRVVIDYRKLNERTTIDKYPKPNITDILDKLGRVNYFKTLDLAFLDSTR